MSEWSDALEALQSDPELTPEQYEEWLDAGNGKFYAFFRAYGKHIGRCEMKEEVVKLLLDTYQERLSDGSRVPSNHNDSLDETIALIKDQTRNITSEILPDGSIYIEEIKGELK